MITFVYVVTSMEIDTIKDQVSTNLEKYITFSVNLLGVVISFGWILIIFGILKN
ncbi:hypothetical protein [Lactobacillus johnsonii]|uniref:hypothetical protein n=1 Tax=Lactobacillus johnsonii TaxID=33959 RepID=UPI0013D0C1BC|nr:hypothetical protein [Lactobacillus johnsonii]